MNKWGQSRIYMSEIGGMSYLGRRDMRCRRSDFDDKTWLEQAQRLRTSCTAYWKFDSDPISLFPHRDLTPAMRAWPG
jgi:hypothetical protein